MTKIIVLGYVFRTHFPFESVKLTTAEEIHSKPWTAVKFRKKRRVRRPYKLGALPRDYIPVGFKSQASFGNDVRVKEKYIARVAARGKGKDKRESEKKSEKERGN